MAATLLGVFTSALFHLSEAVVLARTHTCMPLGASGLRPLVRALITRIGKNRGFPTLRQCTSGCEI